MAKGKPSFNIFLKIMENSIIGQGGSVMSNSIIFKDLFKCVSSHSESFKTLLLLG